mgnify:CR=1 FL=1
MKLLLLPLLLGFSVPAIAHNEFNGGDAMHRDVEEGEEGGTTFKNACKRYGYACGGGGLN